MQTARKNLPVPVAQDVLYRYEMQLYSRGLDEFDNPLPGPPIVQLKRLTFPVIKRTNQGAWIYDYWQKGRNRWVNLMATKVYANETPELAINDFIERKKKHTWHLQNQLKVINLALDEAKRLGVISE